MPVKTRKHSAQSGAGARAWFKQLGRNLAKVGQAIHNSPMARNLIGQAGRAGANALGAATGVPALGMVADHGLKLGGYGHKRKQAGSGRKSIKAGGGGKRRGRK